MSLGRKKMSDGLLADALAARAQRDASRATPGFSQPLHESIMQAVSEAPLSPPAHARGNAGRTVGIVLSLAAVFGAAFIGGMRWPIRRSRTALVSPVAQAKPQAVASTSPEMADPAIPVLALEHQTDVIDARVQTAMQTAMSQQWIGLDHDVRSATQYLMDQIPFSGGLARPAPAH